MPIGFWSISRAEIKRILEGYVRQGTLPPMLNAEMEHRVTFIKKNLPDKLDQLVVDFVLDPYQFGYYGYKG